MNKLTKGKSVKKTKKVNKVKSKESNTKNRKHLKKESSLHKSSKTKKVNHKKKRYNLNKNNRKNKTVKRKKNHQVKKVVRNLKNKFINRTQKYVVSKSKQVGGTLQSEFNNLMDEAKNPFASNFLGVVRVPLQIDNRIEHLLGLLFVQVFEQAEFSYSIYTFVKKTDEETIKAIKNQFSDNKNINDITVFPTDSHYIVRLKKEECKQLYYTKKALLGKGEVYIFYKDGQPNLNRDFVIPANDKNTDALEKNQRVDMQQIRKDLKILTHIKNDDFIQHLINNFLIKSEENNNFKYHNKFYGHLSLFRKPPVHQIKHSPSQKQICKRIQLEIDTLTAELYELNQKENKNLFVNQYIKNKEIELQARKEQYKDKCQSSFARIGSSLKRTLGRTLSRKSSSSSPPPPPPPSPPPPPAGSPSGSGQRAPPAPTGPPQPRAETGAHNYVYSESSPPSGSSPPPPPPGASQVSELEEGEYRFG